MMGASRVCRVRSRCVVLSAVGPLHRRCPQTGHRKNSEHKHQNASDSTPANRTSERSTRDHTGSIAVSNDAGNAETAPLAIIHSTRIHEQTDINER
jgi:hypothetical protein